LGYVKNIGPQSEMMLIPFSGWKQFMEWKYPVEVVITSKAAFKGTGAVVAASL
jgi:hypothetical protein